MEKLTETLFNKTEYLTIKIHINYRDRSKCKASVFIEDRTVLDEHTIDNALIIVNKLSFEFGEIEKLLKTVKNKLSKPHEKVELKEEPDKETNHSGLIMCLEKNLDIIKVIKKFEKHGETHLRAVIDEAMHKVGLCAFKSVPRTFNITGRLATMEPGEGYLGRVRGRRRVNHGNAIS